MSEVVVMHSRTGTDGTAAAAATAGRPSSRRVRVARLWRARDGPVRAVAADDAAAAHPLDRGARRQRPVRRERRGRAGCSAGLAGARSARGVAVAGGGGDSAVGG